MINKILFLVISLGILYTSQYQYSTTSVVTLTGGIIKASSSNENIVKPKRANCNVCKGKGWYMSGDGIKKIECQYCEP